MGDGDAGGVPLAEYAVRKSVGEVEEHCVGVGGEGCFGRPGGWALRLGMVADFVCLCGRGKGDV